MKYVCRYKSMLRGDVVKVGQTVDLTPEECKLDVVKAYFVPCGDGASASADEPRTSASVVVAGLTRDQAIMKLQEAGQRVSSRISDERLAERYEDQFGHTVAEA